MKKWLFLFGSLLIVFRGTFSTYIFQDDFFAFGISRVNNFNQFLSFFSIFKHNTFYRPLSTEVFYFLTGLINNLFLTRLFVFGVFFTGLIFLYKIIVQLTKKEGLAFLTIVIYAFSFTHVFQLYWLATFQEVALFTFSCITVYLFIAKRPAGLIFFLLALLSKESAVVLPSVLVLLTRDVRRLVPYFLLLIPFLVIYKLNYAGVALKPEYAPNFSPRLIGNNLLWYGLWGLGLPNFFPDFITSLFSFSTKTLWDVIIRNNSVFHLISWAFFMVLFMLSIFLSRSKKLLFVGGFCLLGFLIYILPISIIIHKWMVRLTIPVVFSSFFLAYLISSSKKWLGIPLLIFYILYNLLAIPVHENTSTYKYESSISLKAKNITSNNNCLYFADDVESKSGWEGSQKLKLTLFDQWFTRYYWPNKNIKVYYGFETKVTPVGCTVINSKDLL